MTACQAGDGEEGEEVVRGVGRGAFVDTLRGEISVAAISFWDPV